LLSILRLIIIIKEDKRVRNKIIFEMNNKLRYLRLALNNDGRVRFVLRHKNQHDNNDHANAAANRQQHVATYVF
jgi:hypothetical protein